MPVQKKSGNLLKAPRMPLKKETTQKKIMKKYLIIKIVFFFCNDTVIFLFTVK